MTDANSLNRVPVLIAGADPVGLSLAIELALRGIRSFLVEQTDGSVDFSTTNLARTCEHLRRWGIADRMRYQSGYPTDYPRNFPVYKLKLTLILPSVIERRELMRSAS